MNNSTISSSNNVNLQGKNYEDPPIKFFITIFSIVFCFVFSVIGLTDLFTNNVGIQASIKYIILDISFILLGLLPIGFMLNNKIATHWVMTFFISSVALFIISFSMKN